MEHDEVHVLEHANVQGGKGLEDALRSVYTEWGAGLALVDNLGSDHVAAPVEVYPVAALCGAGGGHRDGQSVVIRSLPAAGGGIERSTGVPGDLEDRGRIRSKKKVRCVSTALIALQREKKKSKRKRGDAVLTRPPV